MLLVDLAATLGFAALVVGTVWQMRKVYALYVVPVIVVPLLSGTMVSMTRYALLLAPCYMLLAKWGRKSRVHTVIMLVFLPLMALLTVLFTQWYWVG
jgi:hypothetical protein